MRESHYLKDTIKYLEKLKQIPTLEPFEDEDIKGLLALSKIRKYDAGELILEEGYYDSLIYFLISGKVRVLMHGEELHVLERTGDVFGEMSIIDSSPRSATVYAIDETVCLATDSSYVDRLSGNDKLAFCYILYRLFSEVLANRLRSTSEELIRLKDEVRRLRGDDNDQEQ
jgi:CRP-like cAMP-binding protein